MDKSSASAASDNLARLQSQADEIVRLRRELDEKIDLIDLLKGQLGSPTFLLQAAIKNIGHLIPHVIRMRRERRKEKRQLRSDVELIRESAVFESDWYLQQHPDVARDGVDPILHYLTVGAALGYDPSRDFSTKKYLEVNADVARAKVNPLVHYLRHGRNEGRLLWEENEYDRWVKRFDTLTDADRAAIRSAIDAFPESPLISVLMPVYNTESIWLTRAIESVRAQLYPNWELCISDDASSEPHIRTILDRYALLDPRIRVGYRDENGHISVNSNSALALASGRYIALLDDDDRLAEHALFWVANEILWYPDVDLIYSDEDKIDVFGRRYDAYFKPDWNPALMLSQNLFSHLGVYRRSLVEKVGGFRVGFEGSQDHDLLLRCVDASAPERIRHIPRVLYHWRARPGSTASAVATEAKPYAWQAGAEAIEEHLQRRRIAGKVEMAREQYYQVTYPAGAPLPRVSIIMPSACQLHLLRPCLESLFARTTYPDFELLLVVSKIRFEDREQAAYLDELKSNPRVRILGYDDRPYNFSWLNNWAVPQSTGSVLCLMNDDIEVITPDWLEKMVARLQLDGVGAVGPMLYYPDDTIQHAGVILGLGGVSGHSFRYLARGEGGYFGRAALEQDLSCVTAACMALRRSVFDELNGFDEALSVAFNDVDFCIRMRQAGWRIIWTPQVELYHHESASLGQHDSPERKSQFNREVALMHQRWGEVLDNDPFYNPNLSLMTSYFTLADPPRISKFAQGSYSCSGGSRPTA